ncbi:hypothetical protein K435DRAFT_587250, partial [Dendrothele bispora CBS 962.96]
KLHIPYPENAHGFYYFYKPSENVPKFAGGIRFRVCSSPDPENFQDGYDLLGNSGLPWQLSNFALAIEPFYKPFGEELVRNGELKPEVLEQCRELARSAKLLHAPHQTVVYALKQPFPMILGQATARIWVANEKRLVALTLRNQVLAP